MADDPKRMKDPIRTSIKNMVTSIDGETVDPARVLWILGTVVYLIGSLVQIVRCTWDAQTYGIGLAAVLGGGALGVKAKESSEPKENGQAIPPGRRAGEADEK